MPLTRRALLLALLLAPLSAAAKPKPRRALTRLKGAALGGARARRALILFSSSNDAWVPVFNGRYISTAGSLYVLKHRDDIQGTLVGAISPAQLAALHQLLVRCAEGTVVEERGGDDAGIASYVGFFYKEGAASQVILNVSGDKLITNQAPEVAQLIERFDACFAAKSGLHAPVMSPW